MKNICLIFLVHQPLRLKRYRFFEIGDHHPYLDEQANADILIQHAKTFYLPSNNLLLRQISGNKGKIRVAFYLSGTTAELLEKYAKETYDSFRELAATGDVEFLTGTYSWSLSSLWDETAFRLQTADHRKRMEQLTGKRSSEVFFNTDLLYNSQMGAILTEMGMEGIITEGDKQVLGWKSPDILYSDARSHSLKLFFRNPLLSNEFIRFITDKNPRENALTPTKFQDRLLAGSDGENLVNLIIPYENFTQQGGNFQGIRNFMDHFLYLAARSSGMQMSVPSDFLDCQTDINSIQVSRTISMDGGNSLFPEGSENDLQREALSGLYELAGKIGMESDNAIMQEWNYLQCSDHFRHMSIQPLSKGYNDKENPYNSPFEAFINFMNILNDFKLKLDYSSKK